MYATCVKDSLYLKIFLRTGNRLFKKRLKLNVYFALLCCICFLSE